MIGKGTGPIWQSPPPKGASWEQVLVLMQARRQEELTQVYEVFQQEVIHHNPDYAPEIVTTDGWAATRGA